MIKGIAHIGIAVRNIEESVEAISKAFDLPMAPVIDNKELQRKFALFDIHGVALEFIEDYSEKGEFRPPPYQKGNAIHHFCLLTDDIEADVEKLKNRGVEMADDKPFVGMRGKKRAFTRPSVLNGIPIELTEA